MAGANTRSRGIEPKVELTQFAPRSFLRRLADRGFVLQEFENTLVLPLRGLPAPRTLLPVGWPEGVRIEVQDEAPGTVEAGSLETAGERGSGLALVGALASCWGVDQHEGGKSVWFELHA